VVKETPAAGRYTQTVIPTTGCLDTPRGVAVDLSGNINIADTTRSVTRYVNPPSRTVITGNWKCAAR
jgi:hypothetical protein